MVNIQEFLKYMIAGGFGVREIARMSEVSPATISRLANGKVSPDIATVNKILKSFAYELRIVKREVFD